jgi:hypothetical protein
VVAGPIKVLLYPPEGGVSDEISNQRVAQEFGEIGWDGDSFAGQFNGGLKEPRPGEASVELVYMLVAPELARDAYPLAA